MSKSDCHDRLRELLCERIANLILRHQTIEQEYLIESERGRSVSHRECPVHQSLLRRDGQDCDNLCPTACPRCPSGCFGVDSPGNRSLLSPMYSPGLPSAGRTRILSEDSRTA